MKIVKKIVFIIMIIAILSVVFIGECRAALNFNPIASFGNTLNSVSNTPLMGILQLIFAVVQVGITGVLVIHLTWIGIQYFLSATANDKAMNKTKFMWAILRIVLWFTCMALIVGLFDSLAG